LLFGGFRLFLLAFRHHGADGFADRIALRPEIIRAGVRLAKLGVQRDYFVHQRELVELKLLFDVLFYQLRLRADEFNVQHTIPLYMSV